MRIDVLTLFPEMFAAVFDQSIVKRAREKKLVDIVLTNIRDYALDKHRSVDDKSFGGGPGMVLMCQPIFDAVEDITAQSEPPDDIILMTPQGRPFDQSTARELAGKKRLVVIAGHYEGFDERIREHLATREISIGDYVLTGGELPAMVLIDSITRLLPGALGDDQSAADESFNANLLEYPQYTRPADYKGFKTPDILLSGNHQAIRQWRQQQAEWRTKQRRPDLADKTNENEK